MGKLFFVRKKNPDIHPTVEALIAQNKELMALLAEKSNQPAAPVERELSPLGMHYETDLSTVLHDAAPIEEEAMFIPKAAKATSDIKSVETSSEEFDTTNVEKIKKTKEDRKKNRN